MAMLNKQEIKYILYCAAFAILYFFLGLPYLIKIIDGNSLLQFLIFDLGIVVLLNIYFKSRSDGTKINFIKSMEYMCVVLAIAIFIPPYQIVPWTGQFQPGATLGTAAVDYFFASMGKQYLHLSGILISIWTYVVVPVLLLFIASKISKSNFVKTI